MNIRDKKQPMKPTQPTKAAAEQRARVLGEAIHAFGVATGLILRVEKKAGAVEKAGGAMLRLEHGGRKLALRAHVVPVLTTQTLGAALAELGRLPGKAMLVTEYVNPNMAERLRQAGAAFIDAAGNAFLDFPPLLLFLTGKKPPRPPARAKATRAFQPTGLRVVFALLQRPELARAPYRDIAGAAGVALGTVGWVINDLKALGFLADKGKHGRELVERMRLIDRWAAAYPEQLRPKLHLGNYAAADDKWWEKAKLKPGKEYWSGEVAAARATYLKPEKIAVYLRENPADFLLRHGLWKDPDGNTELLEVFWTEEPSPDDALAPPLVVYADLLIGGDPRNLEAARLIHERHPA